MDKVVSLKEADEAQIVTIIESTLDIDGSFLVCSLLEERLRIGETIVLILHHHGFGHYLGVGSKLGVNLQKSRDAGKLIVIDVMDMISEAYNQQFGKTFVTWNLLEKVLSQVKSYSTSHKSTEGLTVVVDHPGNIGLAFEHWHEVLTYVTHFQSLAMESCSIIYTSGPSCPQLSALNASLRHYADMTVMLRGLTMGKAADISGAMEIIHRRNEKKFTKAQNDYHFQLLDRKVKLFAPGTVQFRS